MTLSTSTPGSGIAVNGKTLADRGLYATNLAEFLSVPEIQHGTQTVFGRAGQVPSIYGTTYKPRQLQLAVWTPSSVGDATAARNALGAWYQDAQGILEIETVDAPGRVCYGLLERGQGGIDGTMAIYFNSSNMTSAGTILCFNPFWADRVPTSIGSAGTEWITVPVGTAPSKVRLQIVGPYTNPTFSVRRNTGDVVGQMRFTDTAADTGTWLDIDPETGHIDRWVSGVRSAVNNGWSLLNAADTFPTFDPLDAPTADTSSGSFTGLVWRSYQV